MHDMLPTFLLQHNGLKLSHTTLQRNALRVTRQALSPNHLSLPLWSIHLELCLRGGQAHGASSCTSLSHQGIVLMMESMWLTSPSNTPQSMMPWTPSYTWVTMPSWQRLMLRVLSRLYPVHATDHHHLLGYQWQGRYYYDRVLPFCLRSAPYIFNCLAEAIEWLMRQQGARQVHHYLDDFFVAGSPHSSECARYLHRLTSLCAYLNIPIILDSAALEARLPATKLSDIKTASSRWIHRSQCSKSDLLSLIGTLSFATKVVHAGRTFLRRMIDLSTTVPHRRDIILLNEGFRLDLQWWDSLYHPMVRSQFFFLLPHWTPAPDLHLYTDSFSEIGFGAYLNGEWFHGRWPPDQLHYSIQYKELYPIVVAAQVWGRRWTTLKVTFSTVIIKLL